MFSRLFSGLGQLGAIFGGDKPKETEEKYRDKEKRPTVVSAEGKEVLRELDVAYAKLGEYEKAVERMSGDI